MHPLKAFLFVALDFGGSGLKAKRKTFLLSVSSVLFCCFVSSKKWELKLRIAIVLLRILLIALQSNVNCQYYYLSSDKH